jgi:superfamily II DNA or RNA helicase
MMSHFKLRDYQEEIIDTVVYYLKDNERCCVSLATGGGKTVIFSELVNRLQGRILICVHREELVYQTSKTLQVEHDLLVPKTKHIKKDICVSMVQTLNNRLKKGQVNINDFDYLIIDEAHRGEFMKILDNYKGKVIGFTATPNYEKNIYFWVCSKCGTIESKSGECCKRKTQKYRQNIPLKKYYHKLIEGVSIGKLIEKGFLVPDENFVLDIDTSKLVYDDFKGDYTEESIGLVFGSEDAIKNTINVYKELALNKKTIIFNPNTLVNKKLYSAMLSEGFNVKMYDSVNSEENRHDLVEWFKNTPNAILLNVQIFTTGFDCTDVEVIFLNKKTKSINLFLQMVGRGGRITDEIFKPSFRVIDMGNNAEDFGKWSDERNWNYMFSQETVKEVGKPQPTAVRTCHSCEGVVAANSLTCPLCGAEKSYTNGQTVVGLPRREGKPTIPSPNKIIDYCLRNNLECVDARKIVYNYVALMFEDTPYDVFLKHYSSNTLFYKTQTFIKPYYFAIQKSELKGNKIRKLYHFTNETIRTIKRHYDNSRKYNTSGNIQVV